jgi:Lon protease-like protein
MAPKKLSKKDETEIAQALAKFKRDLPDDVDKEKVEDLVKAHQAELARTYQQKKKRKACEAPCAAIATDVDTCIFAASDDTKTNLQ